MTQTSIATVKGFEDRAPSLSSGARMRMESFLSDTQRHLRKPQFAYVCGWIEDRLTFPTGFVHRQIIRTIASDTMHGFGTVETSIHQRLATGNPVRADCAHSSHDPETAPRSLVPA